MRVRVRVRVRVDGVALPLREVHGEQRVVRIARQLAVRRCDLLLEGRLVRLPLLHQLGECGLCRVRRFPQVRHLVRVRIRVRVRVRVRGRGRGRV